MNPQRKEKESEAGGRAGSADPSDVGAPSGSAQDPGALTIDMTVAEAVLAVVDEPRFQRLVRFFTGADAAPTLRSLHGARTEVEFQSTLAARLLAAILARTAKRVEILGTQYLQRSQACLYISNHRDILLDSALLNRALIACGTPLPRIVIGDNLLRTSWLRPIFRLCRCIVVQRGLKGKALYEHSLRVSEFVRGCLSAGDPVWIAQRQGRTKDGVDKTEPALLRMLLMAYDSAPPEQVDTLQATPVAVSYEIEPCDTFKAAALIGARTKNQPENRARRDVGDILRGLLQPKGRIRLAIRPPIDLSSSGTGAHAKSRADAIAELAQAVDDEISKGYTVWPTNYAAYDLLHRTSAYADRYSPEEREAFVEYVHRGAQEIDASREDAVAALFTLYSRSVPPVGGVSQSLAV